MAQDIDFVEDWLADYSKSRRASRLRQLYELLADHLFSQYEPTKINFLGMSRDFFYRLNIWLLGFKTEDERWAAFCSIEYLFFAGQAEFEELYRCAAKHALLPWIVEKSRLNIFSENFDDLISGELESCWCCPVTDSLRINGFLHLTGVRSKSLRPDWLSLRDLGCEQKIKSYIENNNIKYLILIEDFVGSGGQLSRALRFAAQMFEGPILLVPLIVCEKGNKKVEDTIKELGRDNISYSPQLVLSSICQIAKDPLEDEPPLFAELRRAMSAGYKAIGENLNGEEFGWQETGSLVVLYSNCPNNTPPIYHHSNQNWRPIFPRQDRERWRNNE